MKFSEVHEMIRDYEYALYSPSRTGMHLGCECGCGGNKYTVELWDAEEQFANEAIAKAKRFCSTYLIEFDGED